jgi:hypothetical protein
MKRHDNATRSRTAGDRYARRQISPVERAPGWPWSSAAVIAALRLHPLAGYGCLGPATERRRLARLPGGRSPFTTAPTADARLAQRNLLGSWRRMPIDRRPRKSAGPKSGPNALSSGLACLSIPLTSLSTVTRSKGINYVMSFGNLLTFTTFPCGRAYRRYSIHLGFNSHSTSFLGFWRAIAFEPAQRGARTATAMIRETW